MTGVPGEDRAGHALAAMPREIARVRPRRVSDALTAYLFLAPYLTVFLLFLLLPVAASVAVSFTRWGILGTPRWLGVQKITTPS